MPTTRPFAYNTGPLIDGTEQYGNLAIGVPLAGFESTGLQWWNGPDEDPGYIIAHEDPGGRNTSVGITGYLGFWRSISKTDSDFLNLANYIGDQNFNNGSDAASWLNSNGYWTTYPITPTDAIYDALSPSGQSAYNASSVGNFFEVSKLDYDSVFTAISATKYGNTDSEMTQSGSAWASSCAYTLPNTKCTVGNGIYLVGFSCNYYSLSSVPSPTPLISTTYKGTYTAISNSPSLSGVTTGLRYMIRKSPQTPTSATSYLAFVGGAGTMRMTTAAFSGGGYDCSSPYSTWTLWNTTAPASQFYGTSNKQW